VPLTHLLNVLHTDDAHKMNMVISTECFGKKVGRVDFRWTVPKTNDVMADCITNKLIFEVDMLDMSIVSICIPEIDSCLIVDCKINFVNFIEVLEF
jgi:hypothetical protein